MAAATRRHITTCGAYPPELQPARGNLDSHLGWHRMDDREGDPSTASKLQLAGSGFLAASPAIRLN